MTAMAASVAYCLLGAAAAFQAALALGAPWGRYAYGGRSATEDGRLPARLRLASGGTVLALAGAAGLVRADTTPAMWALAAMCTMNTAANLSATHPVERWGTSTATLILAGAFLVLAVT